MTSLKEYTMGDFWNKILSATAMAIVVAVTPSAIVGPPFPSPGYARHSLGRP